MINRVLEYRASFDAAHRLLNHGGRCRNLHGHTYHVSIRIEAALKDEVFVIDFFRFKEILNAYDHVVLCWTEDHQLIRFCREENGDVLVLPKQTSIENLSGHIAVAVARSLEVEWKEVQVNLQETEKGSCASVVRPEDI